MFSSSFKQQQWGQRHHKRRSWYFVWNSENHLTVKQASHYYNNTGWRSVLKLQSKSTSTPHCDRDCHPARDKTKEGCAPHRLLICTAPNEI